MFRLKPHWQILLALGAGLLLALLLRAVAPEPVEGSFASGLLATLAFVGGLFIQALKMIIVPLVVTSVVAGIAGLHGVEGFGRLGLKTFGFYALSSLLAILVGLTLVNLFEPGLENGQPSATIQRAFEKGAAEASASQQAKVAAANEREATDYFDIFKKMFPPNIFEAATDNGQLLGLIVFSLLFAIAMTRLPLEKMATLRDFFVAGNEVMIVVTRWIMALAPLGVFALIVPVIHDTGAELFVSLGKYFFTVLLALGFHLGITMPLILRFVARVNPWRHFQAMREALLLAFSTASSSATLPVTMRCIQENAGVSRRTSSFTLPLGATVNMDGTALYECVAVIFVAQVMGVATGFGEQFIIVVAALLTSIGVAGIPSASLVAILLILKNSQVPGAENAVIALLAVDRLLDMSRTAVNVFGDSCCAVTVAKSEGEDVLSQAPAPSL
ncbi:MAG: dicarboxylate/amino acid:cation symporter [Verrucomicrobiota bacterium]